MQESFNEFLYRMGSFSLGSWEIPVLGGIIFLVASAVLIIANYFLRNFIKNKRVGSREIENIYNSIYFFQRLVVAIIIIILAVNLLNISSDYVTILSGIVITAVMFASVKALNNFVAGIYITITRPFGVGDYIDVGGVEGLVTEITLNYTKILHKDASITHIPNLVCLNSRIINYTLSIEAFQDRIRKLEHNIMIKNIRLVEDNNPKLRLTIQKMDEELEDMRKTLEEIKQFRKDYKKRRQKEEEKDLKRKRKELEKYEKKAKKAFKMMRSWFEIEKEKEQAYQKEVKQIKDEIPAKKISKKTSKLRRKKITSTEVKDNLQKMKDAQDRVSKEASGNQTRKTQEEIKKQFTELQDSLIKEEQQIQRDYEDEKNPMSESGNQKSNIIQKNPKEVSKKLQKHSAYVDEDKIIRYTFVLSLEKHHTWNSKCLDEVCQRWKDEFEVTPSWCVTGIGGRINYQFTIITPDPYDIIHFYDQFVKDVYTTVYAQGNEA